MSARHLPIGRALATANIALAGKAWPIVAPQPAATRPDVDMHPFDYESAMALCVGAPALFACAASLLG